jgi:phosphinothricin acetyltransferase
MISDDRPAPEPLEFVGAEEASPVTDHPRLDIRPATASDGEALARIYKPYILNTVVTFEEELVSAAQMAQRVVEVQTLSLPWLVGECQGQVLGYAYATLWRTRASYRYSSETTVYLEPGQGGNGYGFRLYAALLEALRETDIHAAIGGIALPNAASVALHEKLGFEKVAQFPEVGFKLGRWVDVGYWQKLL